LKQDYDSAFIGGGVAKGMGRHLPPWAQHFEGVNRGWNIT